MANTKIPVELSSTPGIVDNSNATAITIDSSENVGIGVTPSAWSGTFKALQVSSSALYNNNDNDTFLGANYFYDGSNKYINSSHATAYGQVDGQHIWYTAPSGTAGNAVTFSERMRIDSSGSLLVNSTSAGSSRLKVVGDASRYGILSENLSGYGAFSLKSTTVAQTWSIGAVDNSSNSDLFIYGGSSAGTKVTLDSSGEVDITGGSLKLASGANRRLFYRSANNDLILESASGLFYRQDIGNTNHSWFTGNSERMRITSSGQVLIGKTSSGSTVTGAEFNSTGTGTLAFSLTSQNEAYTYNNNNSTGATYLIDFRQNNATKGSISCSSSAVAFNTSSDARLKNILGQAKGLEVVNKLNPVNFEWKESKEIQDGLIAQEVMELIPEAVTKNSNDYYEMDYSKLVTPLIKAIQEQQAQIEALQSEINELKNS